MEEPTLVRVLEQRADTNPEQIAVEFDGQELSFRQVHERANQIARHLVARGVEITDGDGALAGDFADNSRANELGAGDQAGDCGGDFVDADAAQQLAARPDGVRHE